MIIKSGLDFVLVHTRKCFKGQVGDGTK